MLAAALVAVVMSVGVCAALTINRIDSGTEAAGGSWRAVASAHAVPSIAAASAASSATAGR